MPKIRITICRGTHLIAFIGIALLLGLALGVFEVRLEPAPLVTVEGAYQLTRDGREKGDGPLFTDGARVYFEEKGPDSLELASVAVEGGATAVLSLSLHDTDIYDLSPLSSEVLAGRPGASQEGKISGWYPCLEVPKSFKKS